MDCPLCTISLREACYLQSQLGVYFGKRKGSSSYCCVCVSVCVCEREIHDDLSLTLRSLLQKNPFHLECSGNLGKCVQGYKKKNICLDLFVGYKSRALNIILTQKDNI